MIRVVLAMVMICGIAFSKEYVPLDEIRIEAKKGNSEAQFNLGLRYAGGLGEVEKNNELAVHWITKSAEQEYVSAQYLLALSFQEERLGLSQDYNQANRWFSKAAEQEHASAQFNLAINYALGRGVPEDFIRSYAILMHAKSNGCNDPDILVLEELLSMTQSQIEEAKLMSKTLFKD